MVKEEGFPLDLLIGLYASYGSLSPSGATYISPPLSNIILQTDALFFYSVRGTGTVMYSNLGQHRKTVMTSSKFMTVLFYH